MVLIKTCGQIPYKSLAQTNLESKCLVLLTLQNKFQIPWWRLLGVTLRYGGTIHSCGDLFRPKHFLNILPISLLFMYFIFGNHSSYLYHLFASPPSDRIGDPEKSLSQFIVQRNRQGVHQMLLFEGPILSPCPPFRRKVIQANPYI